MMMPRIRASALELRLPPPAIAVLAAGASWLLVVLLPALDLAIPGRLSAAGIIGLSGLIIAALGVAAIWQAGTSLEPTRPEAASSLVTSGIYRWTRNPMYLGLAMLLFSWLLVLSNAAAFLIFPGFLAYMTRFQILPEERALEQRFPESFAAYRKTVRRWI